MSIQLVKHPAAAFLGGVVVAVGGIVAILISCNGPNTSSQDVADYKDEMQKAGGSPADPATLKRFGEFLSGIGDPAFVRTNTSKVYAADAYLNDTLVTHRGAVEIEAYFAKTSDTMKSYHTTIDDVFNSGSDYYFRWTMIFAAPALSSGEPIHSVGISQVRFNPEGKVTFHQDFWDSGKNLFGHAPVAGGVISFIRNRL